MDEKLFKILKKTYYKKSYVKDENGYQRKIETGDIFDCEKMTTQYSIKNLSQSELLYLQKSEYPLNEIIYHTHDDIIQELKEIIKHPNISLRHLLSAYIAGFCSFPRGRQPIISYLFAIAVPIHTFSDHHNNSVCEICALKKEFWLEKGNEIFRCYWGYSWNESISKFHLDLEEFSELPLVTPTEEDLKIFLSVINLIRNAPAYETVGKLEQRIMKAKLIPNCEKYRLRGQLIALAELGVMPNRFVKPLFDGFTDLETLREIKVPGSSRSDVVLPLSGWRGEYGICEERFKELFESFCSK